MSEIRRISIFGLFLAGAGPGLAPGVVYDPGHSVVARRGRVAAGGDGPSGGGIPRGSISEDTVNPSRRLESRPSGPGRALVRAAASLRIPVAVELSLPPVVRHAADPGRQDLDAEHAVLRANRESDQPCRGAWRLERQVKGPFESCDSLPARLCRSSAATHASGSRQTKAVSFPAAWTGWQEDSKSGEGYHLQGKTGASDMVGAPTIVVTLYGLRVGHGIRADSCGTRRCVRAASVPVAAR